MIRRPNIKAIAGGMLVLLALLAATSAFAQLPNVGGVPAYAPPFDMIGFIQKAGLGSTVDSYASFNRTDRTMPGWMYVNGHPIIVPRNTVLQMPAASMTWADLFDPAGSPYVDSNGTHTGMAMEDSPKMDGTFEVHVQGNIVNGTYIAGLIFIAQQSLNTGNGFIDHFDYATGDIYVSGGPGGTSVRLQINDPLGRFGLAHSPDPRFTIDEDNPTIHAETGYPMCVPRYDPTVRIDNLCPSYNRPRNPAGGYVMNFTMPAPARRTSATDQDARLMAPFEPGDYITYTGVVIHDSNQPSQYYVSVYNIDANVGIYTAPGSDPVYVVMGEFEQGTGGIANVAFPQETTSRVKVEGMSTDETRTVSIHARDTDCNGVVQDRSPWVSNFPLDPGPPVGAKRGRIRWRTNGGPFLPPAKEIHVIVDGANTFTPTANGLFPGQYYAPEFGFIFPENLGVGDPPVTLNLGDFVWLVNGIGTFESENVGGTVVNTNIGQLSPWPDLVAPAATCTFNQNVADSVITADAGGPYAITLTSAGPNAVTLVGTPGVPSGVVPFYRWSILNADANVALSTSQTNANATLTITNAAAIKTPVTYQVSLVVQNSANPLQQSSASVATVTVNPMVQSPVINTITATPTGVLSGQTFNVSVGAFDPAGLPLTYTYSVGTCASITAGQGTASATFLAGNTATAACSVSVSVSNGSAAAVTRSVAVSIASANGNAPSGARFTATPNPAVSNGNITLAGSVSTNPANLPLSYSWVVRNASTGAVVVNLTGQNPTFVAPTVTFAQRSITLNITLTVTNAAGSTTTSGSVNVNAPPADVLTDGGTVYRQAKSRLTVTVNSSVVSPSIVLTATLDLINPATNRPFQGTMSNLGGGVYTLDFIGVGLPNTITVTSTGGGTVTILRSAIQLR